MKWRCEWCGKPHDENDPPCDNCGHGSFERAVVQRTDPVQGEGPDETIVWVCPACGRSHPKHNPPCSRCGHPKLERQVQSVDQAELSPPGYLDLLTPRYVVALVAVLGLAAVFVLGIAGIGPFPGLSDGVPEVTDVPGSADTADGLSLSAVEEAYIDELNTGREADDLVRGEQLDEVATFYNQRRVKAAYGEATTPTRDRMSKLLGDSCSGEIIQITPAIDGGGYSTADALGTALAERTIAGVGRLETKSKTGVDVHVAPDGTVYLTQYAC